MNLPLHGLFEELVALLLITAAAGCLAMWLRQPLIIAFIAVGIAAGPVGFNVIKSPEQIEVFAKMGLALLLFVVGLKLDPQLIRNLGGVSLFTGAGRMAVMAVIGFGLTMLLGFKAVPALYLAAATLFSSTILIIKLLTDKRETQSLHGRIALGFLIVEDIVVILAMIALSAFMKDNGAAPVVQFALLAVKGVVLFGILYAISKYVFPRALQLISKSHELLILFAIAWALFLATVADLLGFTKEVGAFAAGLTLASTIYRDLLSTKLGSLRDFLLLFFFVELGSHLDLSKVAGQLIAAVPLSLLVLFVKPLCLMIIITMLGFRKRTAFMAGLTASQISEFSLILVAMGVEAGHIEGDILGIVTLVLLITMAASAHIVMNSQRIYEISRPYVRFLDIRDHDRETSDTHQLPLMLRDSVILIGLGSYGSNIARSLTEKGRQVLGIDYDPAAVRAYNAIGGQAVFGDAEDPDFAHTLPLGDVGWVVSAIRDPKVNAGIARSLHHEGFQGSFACTTDQVDEVSEDRTQCADLVFVPFEDAAQQAVELMIEQEDVLERKAMDKLIESLSNHYIVCGYGRMGQQIVKDFIRESVTYVVVEDNPEQLPKLKENRIPHVIGNASDDSSLIQAGVLRAKGLIAVASTDEANVFIVLTSRVLNPKLNIVARSIIEDNEDKLRRAGADTVMSPYVLGGRRMAAAVIKPEVMDFLDLVVHDDGDDTEMATVTIGATYVGKPLKELDPWERCGVSLLALRRPGERLHPNPNADFIVREGDELIVMGTCDEIEDLRKLLG